MKREAPAAARNLEPIVDVLVPLLAELHGDVLEIGSGTGQHAVGLAAALPALYWWPTDPDAGQLASIRAWREECGTPNLGPPVALDAATEHWGLGSPGFPPARVRVVYSANVVHITPPEVTAGLFAGAGRHLEAGGLLVLYGPFAENGRHTAPSNAAFDADLRRRDPRWGVRDVLDLDEQGAAAGLRRTYRIAMPANNHILIYERGERDDDAA